MLDHVSITVSDIAAAERFYDGAKPEDAFGRYWCFKAKSRAQVDAFWHAGIASGGNDEGRPGLRDPDGNRVEAVCHLAP